MATFDMVMVNTLGLNPKAQQNPDGQEFMHHFERVLEMGMRRMFNIHLHSDFIYRLSGLKAQTKFSANYLMNASKNSLNIIRNRRAKEIGNLRTSEKVGSADILKKNEPIKDLDQGVVIPKVVDEAPAKSFAELLMENPNYSEEDDIELISQMITIIGAGQDTTKSSNMATLILLALHPDVQDKVQEELDLILGPDPNSCPSYEDLGKLDYLEMVIKESLRLQDFFYLGLLLRTVSTVTLETDESYQQELKSSCRYTLYSV
uniref:Cytochrome P450 3A31 n=1 Tax=Cacopsylla melanoneura TaxID=428564 RepID=A0A8D9BCR0_9HEMI